MKKILIFTVFLSLLLNTSLIFAQQDYENENSETVLEDAYEVDTQDVRLDDTYDRSMKEDESDAKINTAYIPQPAAAQPAKSKTSGQPVVAHKVQSTYSSFFEIKIVKKIAGAISYAWQKIKDFFNSLPGIRHYNESIYSRENYRKEMRKMGGEYKPHMNKENAGVAAVKKGLN